MFALAEHPYYVRMSLVTEASENGYAIGMKLGKKGVAGLDRGDATRTALILLGGKLDDMATRRVIPSRVPWKYGDVGDSLGVTDKFGNITIKPGLTGKELAETVRHEAVHRFFSPRSGVVGNIHADIGMTAYQRSHLVRFLEEGIAESVATGSLRRGFAFPLTHGYVSGTRVFIEGIGYVTIVGGTAYGVHELLEAD